MLYNNIHIILGIILVSSIDASWYFFNTTAPGWDASEVPNPFTYPLDSNDQIIGTVTALNPSKSTSSTVSLKWDFIEHDSTDFVIFSVSTDLMVDTWKKAQFDVKITVANTDRSQVDSVSVKFSTLQSVTDEVAIDLERDLYVNRTQHDGRILSTPILGNVYYSDSYVGGNNNIDTVMFRFNNQMLEIIFARPLDAVDEELDLTLDPEAGYLVQAYEYEYLASTSYGYVLRNITWWGEVEEENEVDDEGDDGADNVKGFFGASTAMAVLAVTTRILFE